ncbi:twin-arginine translocation signal domain-containing protein [Nitratireductor sp. CAU 1489]|uniref:Twin-arginine translocation signal domain-containing protein n=1 Tax=Nitratireductor arenosus TaxID=2682096 RepID=A0A844QF89_9HYPH|nr:cyclase family protein [Nitratireductor arenosus]MVA96748.1 twin-arginine translocation signal domain-containing protein [Nitratireductor arenosus]
MCHHCVIDSVKDRMLSRRDFFKGGAVAGAAAAASLAAPAPLFAQKAMPTKAEDLTHELFEAFPTFFNEQQLFKKALFNYAEHKFNINEWRFNEHTGTHLDAPLHFSADGKSVAEIPVADLVCPLAIIDIRQKAADNADAQVTPDDITAWTDANGDLPEGACVAMLSGWGAHLETGKFRNVGEDGKTMHFPGFHIEAAQMLMEAPSVKGIAVDTLSLDHGPSPDFAVHYAWLPSGRWGLECVANLESLPASGATLVVGAPKLRGGTGGPSRVIAMV